MTVKVKMCTARVSTEEAALCSPLPSTECDTRGDSEYVWSGRQVLNIYIQRKKHSKKTCLLLLSPISSYTLSAVLQVL